MSDLLAAYDLVLAGPSIVADPASPLLRVGLWIASPAFPALPPGPDFPLPRLSAEQAASCFAATPRILEQGQFAAGASTATLQNLLNAAAPALVAAAANHDLTLDSWTVQITPPHTVATTFDGQLPLDVPVTISITETLDVTQGPQGWNVPAVTHTDASTSTGSVLDWIGSALCTPLFILLTYAALEISSGADAAASKVTGIVQPLLAAVPDQIPFRNTDFSASTPLDIDFPVIDLNWAFFGATDAGLLGTGSLSLEGREQGDVTLTVTGQTEITGPPEDFAGDYPAGFVFALQNLAPDPGAFTWVLVGATTTQGTIEAGPLTQAGPIPVVIRLPKPVLPQSYEFTLTVTATETCGTDPTKTLTAEWSAPVTVTVKPSKLPPPVKAGPGLAATATR